MFNTEWWLKEKDKLSVCDLIDIFNEKYIELVNRRIEEAKQRIKHNEDGKKMWEEFIKQQTNK